jgi:hypothetical protein
MNLGIINSEEIIKMELNQIIEELRVQMIELAIEKGDFLDENVVTLSQELDIILVQYERRKMDIISLVTV